MKRNTLETTHAHTKSPHQSRAVRAGLSAYKRLIVGCILLAVAFSLVGNLAYAQTTPGDPPPSETAPASCEDTYKDKQAEIDACKQGAENADEESYCEDLFKSSDEEKAACKYGQTIKASGDSKKSNCKIDGIGWLICPVVTFLGKIVDQSYSTLERMLNVSPLSFSSDPNDPGAGLYSSWKIMRDFANVVFIIGFLFIVFSQVTSVGASNYGIKKMLPKLIIAAILVNISYIICAAAVDLSNIFGNSLKEALESIGNKVSSDQYTAFMDRGGWTGLATTILTGAGLVGAAAVGEIYLGLAIFLPILFAAISAIVVVIVVLTIRQAAIILLIVISPLAFVSLLLPNTEGYFKRWREFFTALLIMYPAVALIFGGSKLASKIIMASDPEQFTVQVMGAGVSIIPLFITPLIMRVAGGVLNRFAGIVNDPNRGLIDRARRGAEGRRQDLINVRDSRALAGERAPGGSLVRRRARTRAVRASLEGGVKYAETKYIADQAAANKGENRFAEQMAGRTLFTSADEGSQNAVVANAEAQLKKAFQEDVSNMEVRIRTKFESPQEALKDAIESGDKVQAVAAQNLLFQRGGSGISDFRKIIEDLENSTNPEDQTKVEAMSGVLRKNIDERHGQAAKAKGADIVKWATAGPYKKDDAGNIVIAANGEPVANENYRLTTARAGRLSDVEVASQHPASVNKMITQNQIDYSQAHRMLTDPRISANLAPEAKASLARIPIPPNWQPDTPSSPSPESTPPVTPPPTAPSSPTAPPPTTAPAPPPSTAPPRPTTVAPPSAPAPGATPGYDPYEQRESGIWTPRNRP